MFHEELKMKMDRYAHFKMERRGFTLLEVLVSITVITIGVISVFIIINNSLSANKINSAKLTAAYLAQEGIEIVRNIRDTNWLEQRTNSSLDWRDGIPAGDGEADYNDQSLSPYNSNHYLNIDDVNGLYSYESGTATNFIRKINVQYAQINLKNDVMIITITVTWKVAGSLSYTLSAREDLYNWR